MTPSNHVHNQSNDFVDTVLRICDGYIEERGSFKMANMVQTVRSLNNQAGSMKATDTKALESLRASVNGVLTSFNAVSDTMNVSGAKTENSKVNADKATLPELQKMLSEMQSGLSANISKVGVSMSKAIANNAQTTTSSSVLARYGSASTYSSPTNSLSALWVKLYGSGKTYL